MSIFSYHLLKTSPATTLRALLFPPKPSSVHGLLHGECMACMTLGSPLFSSSRILMGKIAFFAQWENEDAIDEFLANDTFGKKLDKGWHTRLLFRRKWGNISAFKITDEGFETEEIHTPVVAVTLARMRMLAVPRFLKWGRPVEKLVRDHPGTTLSLASIRLPRTVSTFSIWKSQKQMTDMVHGHSEVPKPKRHIDAMKERDRKDFHFEFTTLRFHPISEHGEWEGRTHIIPNINQ